MLPMCFAVDCLVAGHPGWAYWALVAGWAFDLCTWVHENYDIPWRIRLAVEAIKRPLWWACSWVEIR